MSLKKIIKIIAVLPALLFAISGRSQESNFNWEALGENSNRLYGKLTGTIYYVPPDGNLKHFFQDGWYEGTVLLEDGDLFTGLRLRYLAYGDELVVYNPNLRQLFIADKEKVESFTIQVPWGRQEFIKLYFDGISKGDRYFGLLYNGARKLLAFHYIYDEKTQVYRDKYGRLKNSQLRLRTIYYMYDPERGYLKLQSKRRSFIRLFPENKREVRRIFRRNNLRRFDEKELIQAFELLDENGFFN
jgi:hypothetical protein